MKRIFLLASALCVGLLGCPAKKAPPAQQENNQSALRQAGAQLVSAPGRDISGVVTFQETDEGIRIEADVKGLEPGAHGIHIHEKGVCDPPDFTSAGDHFDPDGNPHGAPGPQSHAGDLGNITAGQDGMATMSLTTRDISLAAQEQSQDSVIGRALIIHANPDDLTSQPSGNAGPRIACGIIEAVGQ